jgi:hypothetical protein
MLYLNAPEDDNHLYNYAIYVFTILQDIPRARRVFIECLRRMQWTGPDIAFVLYSYSIFSMVTCDETYIDIIHRLLPRARQAEFEQVQILRTKHLSSSSATAPATVKEIRYGKIFDLANVGFFKYAASLHKNAAGWHAYAVCRWLIYQDFNGSFDGFMSAFHYNKDSIEIKESFDLMMTHFHGHSQQKKDAIYMQRLQYAAQIDAEIEETRRIYRVKAKLRRDSANKIKVSQNFFFFSIFFHFK